MIGYEYLCSQVWAIREENLQQILEIAKRENPSLASIEASLGKTLENPTKSLNQDGTKVINVIGPIVRYGDLFSNISGARSLAGLKKDFTEALNDDSVKSIMLNIDSPGGEANGIGEFADLVYEARGTKPVVSYVGNMACSAAYWIASATDKIICSETATLGSIGCVAVVTDTQEKDTKDGVQKIKFVSTNSPNKRPDVLTKEGKDLLQYEVDKIGDIFIEKVARNRTSEGRTLTFKDVVKNFNKGGVLIGNDAVEVGLADEIGSYESVLNNLVSDESTVVTSNKQEIISMKNEEIEKTDDAIVTTKATTKTVEAKSDDSKVNVSDFEAAKANFETAQAKNEVLEATLEGLKSRLEATERANELLVQEGLVTKAESIAASLSDRTTPAQREVFVKTFVQASNDDTKSPIEGFNRVENLLKVYEDMPKHNLTSETFELTNQIVDEDEETLENFEKVALEYAEKLNAKK